MINSVNLEFLKPKLINMDKFNCPATTKLLPPSTLTQQTKTYVTITGQHRPTNLITDNQQKKQEFILNHNIKHQQQLQQQQHQQERVRVQHLENHTKLQNNKCWNNFRTLNYTSASSQVRDTNDLKTDNDNEIDVVNVEHLQKPNNNNNMETPMNIQNKSAFNLELNNKKYLNNNNDNDSIYGNNNNTNIDIKLETNNNNYNFYNKQQQYGLINNKSIKIETQTSSSMANTTNQRTEDQNNAYRHIESVHNYAKSKSYEDDDDDNQSPNGSRHSSYLDDEEEDEEEDDEEDDDEEYNDDMMDADYDERLDTNLNDLDVDYEDIFNRRRHRFQKLSTSSDGALLTKYNSNTKLKAIEELRKTAQLVNVNKSQQVISSNINKINIKQEEEEEEIHVDVDVETVESQTSPTLPVGAMGSGRINGLAEESVNNVKPDHHARRPMNAFLIFCKRHRAIVKERYKNLENRAITKILGDWWASLDANDKKCFTNLAQQNKDAFFSANPNFKWYKLPAPPLRSLNTRPAYGQEYPDGDNETNNNQEIISNNTRSGSNYFKLADEAQMGDLSHLMQDKTKNLNKSNNDLQQALGETSQFISAHIQNNAGETAMEENSLKRRYHNENSFSSNSSEDDLMEPKKKSARSCKGKRYQELINSGQIATVVKKSKATGRGGGGANESLEINTKQNFSNSFNSNINTTNSCQKRSISECDNLINYDLNGFDLEERIKELPALNLDDYLQRKRNTKKKKKFSSSNGKKRGQRLGNNNNNGNNNINNTSQSNNESNLVNKFKQINENITQRAINKQPTAVGSQKRKARKESITRRDISAIEQEVASLLPLTINGCCYLQAIEKDTETITTQSLNVTTSSSTTTTSPIIPLQKNTSTTVSIDIFNNANNNTNNNNNISNHLNNTLNDNISSSTSDLLILAEVAANRTEL